MTCKTHTILSALRKLREDGFTGKINPALIRELTGFESTGRELCHLRKKGHLVYAGYIYLPAARGTTKANQYVINPASDLIPRDKFDVAQYQKKRVNSMSKLGEIRKIIHGYNGRVFNTSELRKDAGMYNATSQRLEDLANLGEIEQIEKIVSGGRPTWTWREIKINESLMCDVRPLAPIADESRDPWAKVYPEFYRLPNLQGTVRSFCEAV